MDILGTQYLVKYIMPRKDTTARQEYSREWMRKNYTEFAKKKKDRITFQREYIQKAKSIPCKDCHIKKGHWVMQFDHVRGKKICNVSNYARYSVSLKKIDTEIAKCDVVCSNCHADREHFRKLKSR